MNEIYSVRERAEIINNRIKGDPKGEDLPWEESIQKFDEFERGAGRIIVVSGDEDLVHSIHSDLSKCKTIDLPFGIENQYQIIISPHGLL